MINMIEFITAAISLMLTGDYEGWMLPALGEEDSVIVDALLTAVGK